MKQTDDYQLVNTVCSGLDHLYLIESIEVLDQSMNQWNVMYHWDEFEYNEQTN